MRKQYKRSVLGYLWSMLNPLLMMAILAVVFSNIMRQNIQDYAIFLFVGTIPWTFFNQTCMTSLGSIRGNANIISQLPVPKYIFSLSSLFSNLTTLFLSLFPLLLVTLILGRSLHWQMLLLPIVLVPLFFATMGISLVLAVANVFFEDTQHLTDVVFRALYFLTPILYKREQLPDWLQEYIVYNPMFYIVEFTRGLWYYGTVPNWSIYFIHLAGTILLLLLGLFVFKKNEDKFVYFM